MLEIGKILTLQQNLQSHPCDLCYPSNHLFLHLLAILSFLCNSFSLFFSVVEGAFILAFSFSSLRFSAFSTHPRLGFKSKVTNTKYPGAALAVFSWRLRAHSERPLLSLLLYTMLLFRERRRERAAERK